MFLNVYQAINRITIKNYIFFFTIYVHTLIIGPCKVFTSFKQCMSYPFSILSSARVTSISCSGGPYLDTASVVSYLQVLTGQVQVCASRLMCVPWMVWCSFSSICSLWCMQV